jgi:hypothetical protein
MEKIEYSRLLVKRTDQTGVVPTIPASGVTSLSQMIPTDLFVGEFFLNATDDKLWVRTDNRIMEVGEGTGGGSGNLDGGMSNSIYGGTTPIDGGSSF